MKTGDLRVYKRAMSLAEEVWSCVDRWPEYARRTMGYQLVRAVDSVAANISEGHGRYHFGERRQFMYYSRGSIQESITWITKARNRGFIADEQAADYIRKLHTIRRMLNGYIRSLGNTSGKKPT